MKGRISYACFSYSQFRKVTEYAAKFNIRIINIETDEESHHINVWYVEEE